MAVQGSGAGGVRGRARHTDAMDLRPVAAEELPAFVRANEAAFHEDVHPDDEREERTLLEPERTLAVFDGPDIVGTTAIFTRELTVPGGVVPAAAVTAVGVIPTHRRRGVLTALMRRELEDVRAAGEPVAALWASEPAIYGRFGYGLASRVAEVRLRTAGVRLHPAAAEPEGRMALVAPAEAIARVAPLYDAVRRTRPGHLDRNDVWWRHRVYDPEHRREGRSALRAAVHEGPGGAVDGYVLYAVKHEEWVDGPSGEIRVLELLADAPHATAAMWAFLLGLDLTRSILWEGAAPDEPLDHLLAGPQRPRMEMYQNLWVRLVDVGAALAARAYARPVDVVLDVADGFCPWNAGRWRLEAGPDGARCERTSAPADVALDVTDLGAAYLGGPNLEALAAIGRGRELRPGAMRAAALAFRSDREPYCPELF
jgi:predicted acetyltransferase